MSNLLLTLTKSNKKSSYLNRLLGLRSSYLNGVWMMDEASGRTAINRVTKTATVDLAYNGGFETAGAGGADIWKSWKETVGNGVLEDETTLVNAGGSAHAAKITAGASANTYINPVNNTADTGDYWGKLFYVRPGVQYTFRVWTRGDGTNQGRYHIFDSTNDAYIVGTKNTGVTGTTYTECVETFTTPAGCYSLRISLYCSTANGGICYFDDFSLTGTINTDGTYSTEGTTLGQPGIIPGHTSVQVSGANNGVLIGSKSYNTYFNSNKGSAICWGKVDAASRWNDTATHRYLYHIKGENDLNHYIVMGKSKDATNRLFWMRYDGTNQDVINYNFSGAGTTDWFCMGLVWDVLSATKRLACFLYLRSTSIWQVVSDAVPTSGTWDQASYPCTANYADFLAGTDLSTQEWIGWGGPIAEWGGYCLSDAEMKSVMIP